MRSRETRRDIKVANARRQTQALTILTIGTVILGAILFEVDISIHTLLSTEPTWERLKACLVLITVSVYIFIIIGTAEILLETTPTTGQHVVSKIITPLIVEVLFTTMIFFANILSTTPPHDPTKYPDIPRLTLKIEVTTKDIKQGVPGSSTQSPIALATKRALRDIDLPGLRVSEDNRFLCIDTFNKKNQPETPDQACSMPIIQVIMSPVVREWSRHYDDTLNMPNDTRQTFIEQHFQPITLTLDDNTQTLAVPGE